MPTASHNKDKGKGAFQRQRFWARTSAMQLLYQLDMQKDWHVDQSLRDAYDEQLATDGLQAEVDAVLTPADQASARAYSWQLVEGVVRDHSELDALLRRAATNWTLERMSAVDRSILRLATFEICKMSKVSAATAINEAVELAKRFGQAESSGFINGVLDNVRRAVARQQAAAEASRDAATSADAGSEQV